jgi:hypothetical protein
MLLSFNCNTVSTGVTETLKRGKEIKQDKEETEGSRGNKLVIP